MALVNIRISERVKEMLDAKFSKNVKFSWTKKVELIDANDKFECLEVTYTINYGRGKTFEVVFPFYTNCKSLNKPYIISDISEYKIDRDIARLYKLISC